MRCTHRERVVRAADGHTRKTDERSAAEKPAHGHEIHGLRGDAGDREDAHGHADGKAQVAGVHLRIHTCAHSPKLNTGFLMN